MRAIEVVIRRHGHEVRLRQELAQVRSRRAVLIVHEAGMLSAIGCTERRSCLHPTMHGSNRLRAQALRHSQNGPYKDIDEELNAVAAHLRERRPAILDAWRVAADLDPQLTTSNSLPRSQFNDHIPDVLDVFERRLQAWPEDPQRLDAEQKKDAASHGLQRWQQGYRLREVTREWGHLHLVLLDELDLAGSCGGRRYRRPEPDHELCVQRRDSVRNMSNGKIERKDITCMERAINDESKLQRDR